jgi:hypothetical protein
MIIKKISSKTLIDVFINDILHLILYKSFTINLKNELSGILNILVNNSVPINKENRHYDRLRDKPLGKWYYCNNYKV